MIMEKCYNNCNCYDSLCIRVMSEQWMCNKISLHYFLNGATFFREFSENFKIRIWNMEDSILMYEEYVEEQSRLTKNRIDRMWYNRIRNRIERRIEFLTNIE